jgi:hypothetical protein
MLPPTVGLHFQGLVPPWAKSACNGAWQKVMDPSSMNPFGDQVQTIGRAYMPDAKANNLIMQGEAGAVAYFQFLQPSLLRAPWITAWEGPNEPPVQTKAQRVALASFTGHLADLLHSQNYKIVGLNLSVGWPDIGCAADLGPCLRKLDYAGLHEYSAPTMKDQLSWLCLRYRRTVAEWIAAGYQVPPILITELGLDGGVIGQPGKGWKTFAKDRQDYANQLYWYATECAKDGLVVGMVVFTASPNADWQDFMVDEQLARMLQAGNENLLRAATVEESTPIPYLNTPVRASVSQEFGEHAIDYSPYGLIGHNGRDYSVAMGTEVRAAHFGHAWAYDDPGGYGLTVEVWSPELPDPALPPEQRPQYKTIYAHLSKQCVATGDRVVAGQLLGFSGNSGNSTGPHLHFGFKPLRGHATNPGYRDWTDPRFYLEM